MTRERTGGAAVYRMFDAAGRLLYVGCSVQLPVRLAAHQNGRPWWRDVVRVDVEHFDDYREALRVEGEAQEAERPVHNVVRNGRVPNLRARRIERDRRAQERREAEEAALAERGVYRSYKHCRNCSFMGSVEIPRGTLFADHPCPGCGVAPAAAQKSAA